MVARDVVGFIAMCATLTQVLVGLTAQIVKLYRTRSTAGLSTTTFATAGGGFLAWTIYACLRPVNAYVLVPNSLGAVCSALIVAQIWSINRKRQR